MKVRVAPQPPPLPSPPLGPGRRGGGGFWGAGWYWRAVAFPAVPAHAGAVPTCSPSIRGRYWPPWRVADAVGLPLGRRLRAEFLLDYPISLHPLATATLILALAGSQREDRHAYYPRPLVRGVAAARRRRPAGGRASLEPLLAPQPRGGGGHGQAWNPCWRLPPPPSADRPLSVPLSSLERKFLISAPLSGLEREFLIPVPLSGLERKFLISGGVLHAFVAIEEQGNVLTALRRVVASHHCLAA
ncbi:hypothetical protein PVAP13_3NG178601 [Panicum virgatum]|uniref:Uncharacterized protein n=1 Tax=Panicum virgatum TaxID=38727 RepID=A0A8T0U7X8_PANVG|nr:hypothetical protein PVAP13_3NG178601 [Panicum virgatum]